MTHCPVFNDTDPELHEKIEECELQGSGYAIEITDVKAYLEYIKRQATEGED